MSAAPFPARSILFTDFEHGTDRIDVADYAARNFVRWNGGDPFAAGYFDLVKFDSLTVLRVDLDGGGDHFAPLAVFALAGVGDVPASDFVF